VLANTSDVDEFFDTSFIGIKTAIPQDDGGFNVSNPISWNNELAVINALRDSVDSLMTWCALGAATSTWQNIRRDHEYSMPCTVCSNVINNPDKGFLTGTLTWRERRGAGPAPGA
jgi:hypothetical protein